MKKIYVLFVVVLLCSGAFGAAVIPYKNLYVEAIAYPSGAGSVYLEPKNCDDAKYVVDSSEDMADEAFIKLVFAENGGGSDYKTGCNKGLAVYEVTVDALHEIGYELVCLADKITDNGLYGPEDCYPAIHGPKEGERDFNFVWTGQDIININVPKSAHGEDGSSADDTPSREDCAADLSKFHAAPDTYVYAIFREMGADRPRFVEDKAAGISTVSSEQMPDDACHSIIGQRLRAPVRGINIIGGKKVWMK